MIALPLSTALVAILAQPLRAVVAPMPGQPGAKPEVSLSSAPAVALTPGMIYTAERLRDPFVTLAAGAAAAAHPFALDEFSIHNLSLRGIMTDSSSDYALFSDSTYGYSFILRRGRLFDPKGKPVPGVTGKLNAKLKTASLQTQESDVQIFKLGEESTD